MKQKSNVITKARTWAAVGCVLAGVITLALAPNAHAADKQPNIVYFLVDNLGMGNSVATAAGRFEAP